MPEPVAIEGSEQLATPKAKRANREWKPPAPGCAYIRLADFRPLYNLPVQTAFRLAVRGVIPFIRVPGTKVMLFPRARVERLIASWEGNGGRRRGQRAGT